MEVVDGSLDTELFTHRQVRGWGVWLVYWRESTLVADCPCLCIRTFRFICFTQTIQQLAYWVPASLKFIIVFTFLVLFNCSRNDWCFDMCFVKLPLSGQFLITTGGRVCCPGTCRFGRVRGRWQYTLFPSTGNTAICKMRRTFLTTIALLYYSK